ncbi:MAG TPA: hypoxanthine phosphoribosyltransferase [Bacilli bacterium]|jgi:hypoxanthine phosphoribosyltransferase|nr:hypoxanthine phosphoribosyltransferase [Bacilli bacterium]HPV55053.1 hypoxanthine phosphoribosyltransferase [Bacilli bacterium]
MKKIVEEVLLTNEEIKNRCKELGEEVTKDYAGKRLVLICLLKGSVPFATELSTHINLDLEMEFLRASSYDGTNSKGQVKIDYLFTGNLEGKDVLIVEDIIDTGLTLDVVVRELKKMNPKSLEIIALLNKKDVNTGLKSKPKYVGFDIPNKFVVGFGLDYNELYRNLNFIGVLKKEVYGG